MSIQTVAEVFDFCAQKIAQLLHDEGIPLYTREQMFSPYFRTDYFENIDTPLKAYFLGFLFADGCVYTDGATPRLCFSLKEEDNYVLYTLKEELNTESDVSFSFRDNMCTLSITSEKLCSDLMCHGMTPHKETRTQPINIPEELTSHFIRGYFDGDGCICLRKSHDILHKRAVVSFAGKFELLSYIRDVLTKVGISYKQVLEESKTYCVRWSAQKDVLIFANYIYSGDNIFALKRKTQIFLDYIS